MSAANDTRDFYEFIFNANDSSVFHLMIITWSLIQVVSSPLYAGIISFNLNGSLNYQTLIDKLLVYFFSALLVLNLTGLHVTALLRPFLGPLPWGLCAIAELEAHAVVFFSCISVAEVVILRYLYSCVWKSVGALNDELFGRFFAICNALFTVAYIGLEAVSKNFYTFTMAYCTGSDPQSEEYSRSHDLRGSQIAVTGIVCLFVLVAMHLQMKRVANHISKYPQLEGIFGSDKLLDSIIVLVIIASFMPRAYARFVVSRNKITDCPPIIVGLAVAGPYLSCLLLLPLYRLAKSPAMRSYIARRFLESRIIRGIRSVWRTCNASVSAAN